MNVPVSQEWMYFTAVYASAAVLLIGGFVASWYERRTGRVRRSGRASTRTANGGPHRPV